MSEPNIYLPTSEELSDLSIEIHKINVEKGFWDEPNLTKFLMLAAGELFEAIEADRKSRFIGPDVVAMLKRDAHLLVAQGVYTEAFERSIKDTYWDEIADCVIRCMDMHVGISEQGMAHDYNFSHVWAHYEAHACLVEALVNPAYMLVNRAMNHEDLLHTAHVLQNVVVELFHFANQQKAPLWDYINLKVAYNRTRPHLHGKNY